MYECEEGCSKCCGPKSFTVLTNYRVLNRYQQPSGCCCCGGGAHHDTAVFLGDIEVMKEAQNTIGLCSALLLSCFSCTLPCFLMGLCCGSWCGDVPKSIDLKGGFGSESFSFKMSEAIAAANEISSYVQPLKRKN